MKDLSGIHPQSGEMIRTQGREGRLCKFDTDTNVIRINMLKREVGGQPSILNVRNSSLIQSSLS